MSKSTNYSETYNLKRIGSKLIGSEFTFILSERTTTTKKKDSLFLLNLKGNKREYISSLYPTNTKDTYKFDYKGDNYTILIGTDNAILTAL